MTCVSPPASGWRVPGAQRGREGPSSSSVVGWVCVFPSCHWRGPEVQRPEPVHRGSQSCRRLWEPINSHSRWTRGVPGAAVCPLHWAMSRGTSWARLPSLSACAPPDPHLNCTDREGFRERRKEALPAPRGLGKWRPGVAGGEGGLSKGSLEWLQGWVERVDLEPVKS